MQPERDLREGVEEPWIAGLGAGRSAGELGQFRLLGALLGGQFGEPALDGLPESAVSVRVTGVRRVFEFGDQRMFAPFDISDCLLRDPGAFSVAVFVFWGRLAGELGGQQVHAMRAEDVVGEEAVHGIEQEVLANP